MVDVAGESVIVARDVDGVLHAHANVCRHRGSQLCDADRRRRAVKGAIRCPYHAWTYGLDGSLRATPRVDDELDRSDARAVAPSRRGVERDGVRLARPAAGRRSPNGSPTTPRGWPTFDELRDRLARQSAPAPRPMVAANWKIIDRELPGVPALRGRAPRAGRAAARLPHRQRGRPRPRRRRASSSSTAATASPPTALEAVGAARHRAGRRSTSTAARAVFPNVLLDVTGTSASLTALFPIDPLDHGRRRRVPLRRRRRRPRRLRSDADRRLQRARRAARTTRCASASSAVSRRERSPPACSPPRTSLVADFVAHYRSYRCRQQRGGHMTRPRLECSRREFIRESAQLAAMLGVGAPLLQACGGDDDDGAECDAIGDDDATRQHPRRAVPRPHLRATGREVTETDRRRLEPEAGPLAIFNYADYVNPDVVAAFEAKYGVKVEITTIDSDPEMIQKVASGAIKVDLQPLDGAPTRINRLIRGGLMQPINKSYLTNFANVLPAFNDPWYDPGASTRRRTRCLRHRHRIPRRPHRPGPDRGVGLGHAVGRHRVQGPVLGPRRRPRGRSRWRCCARGLTDINTTDADVIDQARRRPHRADRPRQHQGQHQGYKDMPEGATDDRPHMERRHDRAAPCRTCPRAPDPRCSAVWYPPPTAYGVVNNDSMGVMADAKNPVLAHLYINYLLDAAVRRAELQLARLPPADRPGSTPTT